MTMSGVTQTESVFSGAYTPSQFVPSTGRQTILVATIDSKVRQDLAAALEGYDVGTQWARGFEEAKVLLSEGEIGACLCGFGLQDGSYKDLVRHAKRNIPEIPVIIVSTPSCSDEYREYLAAMNAGAFDFLCHPYQKREVERILRLAVASFRRPTR